MMMQGWYETLGLILKGVWAYQYQPIHVLSSSIFLYM